MANDSSSDQLADYYQGRLIYQQGVLDERERIIKLLEEMRDICPASNTEIGEHNAWTLDNAITYIKEKKHG